MEKLKAIYSTVMEFFKKHGLRKPARRFILLGLSGDALMVWTPDGNIVLTRDTAAAMANHIGKMVNVLEEYGSTN
jgi:hypothetical protein